MTPKQVERALKVERALLQHHLPSFIQKTFHTVTPGEEYHNNWHIELIAEYLEACRRREIRNLIINIPPRYLKSIAVNVAFPAWLLAHNPSEKILSASYSMKLTIKHSVDTRLTVRSPWYKSLFPDVVITDDQDEKMKFQTTARGHRIATSVGGTATGEGGNFIIVDDPHNPNQAESDVKRQAALTWFDQTVSTRLNDKKTGVKIVIMQRLHQNDLTGHLLEKGGWEHLSIPAIAERKTIIDFGKIKRTREEGDILHEEREGIDELQKMKNELGSYGFAGQYQQSPAPAGGGIFKSEWFMRYDKPPEFKRIVQSWDTAFKKGQLNDPSVCTTWGETENSYYLINVICSRMDYPELKRAVVAQYESWNPTAVLIEDKASGQSLLQDLRKSTTIPLIAIKPLEDKVTRASASSSMFEGGKVVFPKVASWLTDFETELLSFPNAAHDDQVDSATQFLNWIRLQSGNGMRIRVL